MAFDSLISDFSNDKRRVNTTPEIVTDTFNYGQKLIDTDYLPNISKIKTLKKYLVGVKEMNLYKLGWRFQFGSSTSWAGLCAKGSKRPGESRENKDIYVSIQFTKHDINWKENVRDVIFHEIAHAILMQVFEKFPSQLNDLDDLHGISKGHGTTWKAVCYSLCGHECRIHYENMNFKESFKEYKYTCTYCGNEGFGARLKFTSSCSGCGKPILIEKNTH